MAGVRVSTHIEVVTTLNKFHLQTGQEDHQVGGGEIFDPGTPHSKPSYIIRLGNQTHITNHKRGGGVTCFRTLARTWSWLAISLPGHHFVAEGGNSNI